MSVSARERLLGTARVDRGTINYWGALRNLIVYLVLVLTALLTGHTLLALPLAVGAVLAALADTGEDIGRRLRTMLWATLWICLGALLGDLGSDTIIVSVSIAVIVALVAGYAGVLGPRGALIGVLTLVTCTVFNGAPATERTTAEDVLGIAVGGLVMTLATLTPHARRYQEWRRPGVAVASVRDRLSGQLTSENDWVRHAVRLAVVIGIATLIADLDSYPHDYWVPMTIAWVSKPNREATSSRIIARIAGTIVGVLVTAFLVDVIHLDQTWIAIAAGMGSALAVMFVVANYAVAVIGVTVLVVGLFTFDGDPVGQTIVLRICMTIIAGVMAFLAFYIWPPAHKEDLKPEAGRPLPA